MAVQMGKRSGWLSGLVCESVLIDKVLKMAHITLETSMLPIAIIELFGAYDEQQAEEFCIDMRQLLERREPMAVVTDGTYAEMTNLRTRAIMSRFVAEMKPLSDQYTICTALIIKNPLIHGTIAAMFYLKKPKNPMKVFKTREEAISWTKYQFSLANGA
jgi:hypothetical protein